MYSTCFVTICDNFNGIQHFLCIWLLCLWNRAVLSISLSPSRESCTSSSSSLMLRKRRSKYSSPDHRVRLCLSFFNSVKLRSTAAFCRVFADLIESCTDYIALPRSVFLPDILLISRLRFRELQLSLGLPVSYDSWLYCLRLSTSSRFRCPNRRNKPPSWRNRHVLQSWMWLFLRHSFAFHCLWRILVSSEKMRSAPGESVISARGG